MSEADRILVEAMVRVQCARELVSKQEELVVLMNQLGDDHLAEHQEMLVSFRSLQKLTEQELCLLEQHVWAGTA